jgi:hypothetical protein
MFQVFSRNNDTNGKPFRLILLYGDNAEVLEAYEARSSSPSICNFLSGRGIGRLPAAHMQPKDYNKMKAEFKTILRHSY